MSSLRLDAVPDAKVSRDFCENKKLRTLIFSHGNKSSGNHNAAMLMDYASRGFMTFAIYHTDESCVYTEKKDGTPIYMESTNNSDITRWGTKSEIRIKDINSVYNDIVSQNKDIFLEIMSNDIQPVSC
jgi:hypothetical protein